MKEDAISKIIPLVIDDENLVDLRHIQIMMEWLTLSINNIEKQRTLNVYK